MEQNTMLLKALTSCDIKLAKILIEGGVNLNIKNPAGQTPLMIACLMNVHVNKKIQVIKCLLGNGVDINETDDSGRNAMMYASHSKSTEVIDFLNVFLVCKT
ncbi:Hypothetical predicted protein [Mytilus galloprovincialis]|uniref:Uncharacterized protein n=1 Tax=Mytilus galloprovincialis TaxID=29158 RepID=A0A8B6DMA2_MYTGA|nr:Hypothetical predicted protein [Mytilus galloprovincialis]